MSPISGKKNTITLLEELVPACYVSLEESVREIAFELRNKKQVPILKHHEYMWVTISMVTMATQISLLQ